MVLYVSWLTSVLRTLSEVVTAAVAISCFSIFLFLLSYIRKEYLARVFIAVLFGLAVFFTSDAFFLTTDSLATQFLLQKVHWSAFFLIHATIFHFSVTILSMTGYPLRRAYHALIVIVYAVTGLLIGLLLTGKLYDRLASSLEVRTSYYLTDFSIWVWVWILLIMALCFRNFRLTFQRTKTPTSRRRISYLIYSTIGVQISTTPSIIASLGFTSTNTWWYWLLSLIANLGILALVFMLAYSVVTFCVTWSYRVVRLRLIEWVLRGPITASATLGVVTLVRRTARVIGINSETWTSLMTVFSILLLEYLITMVMPRIRQSNYSGYGSEDYAMLSGIENMMIFRAELETYLESVCSVLCDKTQSPAAFIATLGTSGQVELYVSAGQFDEDFRVRTEALSVALADIRSIPGEETFLIRDGFLLAPVRSANGAGPDGSPAELYHLAILGMELTGDSVDDEIDLPATEILPAAAEDCGTVLSQRRYFYRTYETLESLTGPDSEKRYRNVDLLNPAKSFEPYALTDVSPDLFGLVRDALTHYWGGPKLSGSPLLNWRIVDAALGENDGNRVNALRKVLKAAIEHMRPEGERTISVEWTLYNILDLKFIDGLKVKEIVRKLSMSEADFYRKQKVAIEEVSKIIAGLESDVQSGKTVDFSGTDNGTDYSLRIS